MTYSIVARNPATGEFGVGVASRFFAVGALVPHIRPGAAVATQAFVNPLWGAEGADRIAAGEAPDAVLADFIARDAGAPQRQWHAIDAQGHVAAHTGAACVDWAGQAAGEDVSVAGNMLAGPAVIAAALEAWTAAPELPMPDRLLAAMVAAEAAGGDKRGRQSAAIRVHDGEVYPRLDLRVDDHAAPLDELARLLAVARERFTLFSANMGRAAAFSGQTDRGPLDAALATLEAERAARGEASRSFASDPG
ncbi:DUF1028 domain-containing protein [Albimonas pacifica]|uniref:Uncharacterized conserved protein, Ntn-hydrolase superfamily n=1 Tax=Albimonas pacifica TaxID=1114924 RepID=A0A1I3DEY8_9RHOB|nr:DUF1028 domain-containing protein [Albimonas pacifica]SFH85206.1 Uncharacterized conserved protein, Ntn-hydrolase superfamily [Albimonas pacifica]